MHNARAHVDLVHPGRGWREASWRWPTFQQPPLLGHRPSQIVKADFTMLSENPRAGRESWQIFHPWKILAIPPFSCQATPIITSLAPILEFQYIYDACEVLETTDKATTRTPEQSSRRTAKLSNVSCLENNLVLLGVVHYFKEWVSWLPPEGEERLRLPHKYPLRIYAYWKTSDDEVTIRCFFNMIWSK